MKLRFSTPDFLNPQRLLVMLFVVLGIVVLSCVGVLQIRHIAHERIEEMVAKLPKKLGMPVEIGKWRVGFGSAYFDDIVVGDEARAVISNIKADVSLNPFDGSLGELDSITIYKVRIKDSVERLRGSANQWKTAALADASANLETQKSLDKFFAALPTRRLWIKSAGVTVIDSDGGGLLKVRGLQVLVDKRSKKILFRLRSLKLADGFGENNLQGKLQVLARRTGYSVVLRQHDPNNKKPAWLVSGRVPRDLSSLALQFQINSMPAVFAKLSQPYFSKSPRLDLQGFVDATRAEQGSWLYKAKLSSKATEVAIPLVSNEPVGPVSFHTLLQGAWKPEDNIVTVESATVDIPSNPRRKDAATAVQIDLQGAGHLASLHEGKLAFQAELELPETPCQSLLDASPPGLLPALKGFRLDGDASFNIGVSFDSRIPDGLQVDFRDPQFNCKVLSAPYTYSSEHLNGPFTLQREVSKSDEPIEISVSPTTPGFTPIDAIAKTVDLAFVSSEDVGFWSHKGIDTQALESAFRRNMAEKRVAVGGSTITMQTVKNLFLTQDRTLSRKLQELFLAWHIEHVLKKDRILEIYLNIVEFGPGIYGITNAAQHFFGKHPNNLNLLEAAYLASLLPSPKGRYHNFCQGYMSPGFNGLVTGLLKRMLNLKRIDYELYTSALSSALQFNEQTRASSPECHKHGDNNDSENDSEPVSGPS